LESPERREIFQKSNSKSERSALKSLGEAPVGTSLYSESLFEREIHQKLSLKINQKFIWEHL